MAWSIAQYLGELVCTKISHGSLLCLEMTLWTQNDVSKCDVLKPNGFPAAWNFEQHLSEWLRENDVPKPPNLWARTSYRVNGSCVEDLTSHTKSFRTNLCNHSPGAGAWRVPFEFAPLVSFNLISPVYYPKLTVQSRHWLIWFFVCRCSTELLFSTIILRRWREQEFPKTPRKMFSRTEKKLTCLAKLLLIQKLQLHLSESLLPLNLSFASKLGVSVVVWCCLILQQNLEIVIVI